MFQRSKLSFHLIRYDDGTGFHIMKMAYTCGITGKMEYGPENGVVIEAEGEENNMNRFIQGIIVIIDGKELQIKALKEAEKPFFREFDLIYKPEPCLITYNNGINQSLK